MPACASRVSRRGEPLASTSFGLRRARRPAGFVRASSARSVSRRGLSVRLSTGGWGALVRLIGMAPSSIERATLAMAGAENQANPLGPRRLLDAWPALHAIAALNNIV